MKKKILIGVLATGAVLASLVFASGLGNREQKTNYNLTAKASMKHVPPLFQRQHNLQANQDTFGFDSSKGDAKLVLNIDFTPVGNGTKRRVLGTGHGAVQVGSSSFPFTITHPNVHEARLSNGKTFISGDVDGKIQAKNGEQEITIGIAFVPETDQKFFTLTSAGGSAIAFGENFATEEMIRLQREKFR